jgi:hypothetical protein
MYKYQRERKLERELISYPTLTGEGLVADLIKSASC